MEKQIADIEKLIEENNVSKVILDAYFRITPANDLEDLIELKGGVRIYRNEHHTLLIEEEEYKNMVSGSDLYIVSYSKSMEFYSTGFYDGYFNFEKEIVEDKVTVYGNDSEARTRIIFNFIQNISMNRSETLNRIGYNIDNICDELLEYGHNRGYEYKAWKIVFDNQELFEPLFKAKKPPPYDKYKTFISYLDHDNPKKLAQKLKDEFAGRKGKEIAFLIYCLNKSGYLKNEPIVKAHFYKAMAKYFEESIGKDSAMDRFLSPGIALSIGYRASFKKEILIIQDIIAEIVNSI